MRALAVLAVLVNHFAPSTSSIAPFADYGVRLFFVLSGFLITGILLRGDLRDRPRMLRQFYARRFLRIFPAFYLVLFAAAVLAVPGIRDGLGWSASYAANFWFIFHSWHFPNYMTHFWTLAVEEQFYVLAPAVVLFAPRRHLKTILLCAVAAAVAYRIGTVVAGLSWDTYTRAPTACLDALGLGALLAVTRWRGLSDRWTRWALAAGLPLLALDIAANALTEHGWKEGQYDFQQVTQGLAVALISVWLVARASHGFTGFAGRTLSLAPLVYLGTISYGIYLYHYFAIWGFSRAFGWTRGGAYSHQAVYFLALAAATVAVASLSWFAFERPVNGLKKHFPYEQDRPETHGATRRAAPRSRPLPANLVVQRAVLAAQQRPIVTTLIVGAALLVLFVFLPEEIGDRPYDVF